MKVKLHSKKAEILFYIYFALITIGKSAGLNADSMVLQLITILAFLFLIAKLFETTYTVRELLLVFMLSILGLLIYYQTRREGVLLSIITIIGLKGISPEKLLSIVFKLRLVIYISIISLAALGIINNPVYVHWRHGIGYINRYGMGYDHPNLLHTNLFILVILFIYINYEKLGWKQYSTIVLINTFIYRISFSRTGFYAIIGVVFVTLMLKAKKENQFHYRNTFFLLVMPICLAFTFFTAIYNNKIEFIRKLDILLTGRINFSSHFLTAYPINLFGYDLSNDPNLLDNGYIMLLINYGFIIFCLYIVGYMMIVKRMVQLQMEKELLMTSCFAIYGITEGYIPNIFLNLSLVFISCLLYGILPHRDELWSNRVSVEQG